MTPTSRPWESMHMKPGQRPLATGLEAQTTTQEDLCAAGFAEVRWQGEACLPACASRDLPMHVRGRLLL